MGAPNDGSGISLNCSQKYIMTATFSPFGSQLFSSCSINAFKSKLLLANRTYNFNECLFFFVFKFFKLMKVRLNWDNVLLMCQ
jgi:hypothetical protein